MALMSGKFLIVAKRKSSELSGLPEAVSQRMVRAVDQVFFHEYYFRLR